jgi:hypothetical protein
MALLLSLRSSRRFTPLLISPSIMEDLKVEEIAELGGGGGGCGGGVGGGLNGLPLTALVDC